jgi:predicted RNA binding protein YcfA (HicA-like mRNA interferase family)
VTYCEASHLAPTAEHGADAQQAARGSCFAVGRAGCAQWGMFDTRRASVITYMSQSDRLLLRLLRGTSDANIPFEGLCQLLQRLGFDERIRGSHHIFTKEGVEEILNLQPKGRQAKPYQVKQVRRVLLKYQLGGWGDER